MTDTTDPAVEAYSMITEHQELSDLLQAEVTAVLTAFSETAEIVHQHKRWGGEHIAALDLLGQRPLSSLKHFEEVAASLRGAVEEVLRNHKENKF